MVKVAKTERWARFIQAIRQFFDHREYLEVFTDLVAPAGAFEGTIDPLGVSYEGGRAELHTSPEIGMKMVLAEVRRPIYQICRCFRDDPPSPIHQREFTMLEFYDVECDYDHCIAVMRALLGELADEELAFQQVTIHELFNKEVGVDLREVRTIDSFRQVLTQRQLVSFSPGDSWEDLFFRVMLEKVEPALNPASPTIVKDYPAPLAALAKLNEEGFSERFEIYWKGMELCNGASELTDLVELKRRYQKESDTRRLRGKAPHPEPTLLFEAFEKGLPPCSGVAVGLERLFKCMEQGRGSEL